MRETYASFVLVIVFLGLVAIGLSAFEAKAERPEPFYQQTATSTNSCIYGNSY